MLLLLLALPVMGGHICADCVVSAVSAICVLYLCHFLVLYVLYMCCICAVYVLYLCCKCAVCVLCV